MNLRKRAAMLVAVLAILVTALASVASAGTVYQGADYSGTFFNAYTVYICDKEADGRYAKTVFRVAGEYYWGTAWDNDGSGGACGSGSWGPAVQYHKTCEKVDWNTSYCGDVSRHF